MCRLCKIYIVVTQGEEVPDAMKINRKSFDSNQVLLSYNFLIFNKGRMANIHTITELQAFGFEKMLKFN